MCPCLCPCPQTGKEGCEVSRKHLKHVKMKKKRGGEARTIARW